MNPLAVVGMLGRVPLVVWVVGALVLWGGWNRHQVRSERERAAVAEQSAQQHAAAAKGERDARELEHQSAIEAQRSADAYAKERKRAATAAAGARTELDRLRDALAAASAASAGASNPAAAGGVDGAADARNVLGHCAGALAKLAEAADTCEARLSGLQDWVRAIAPGASAPKSTD